MTKNGSDIPYFWDRARVSDPYKAVPDVPGTVVEFTKARKPASANVLKNVASCLSFWRYVGFERVELELETMDLSRPYGDVGAAIKRQLGARALDGYCLSIWGWRESLRHQIGRLRIYDLEPTQHGLVSHYGVIGDMNVPNVLMAELLEPMTSLAVFVCEVNELTPVLALASRSKGTPILGAEIPLIRHHELFAKLAERNVVAMVDPSLLRLYRGMAHAIYLGGGVTPDDPTGSVHLPVRLGKTLRKILCIHLKQK